MWATEVKRMGHTAKRILRNGKLSKQSWDFKVPEDMVKVSRKFGNNEFICFGRWRNEPYEPYICLVKGGRVIYITKDLFKEIKLWMEFPKLR